MEKVQNVSINGVSFILEESAYDSLKNYLEILDRHYSGNANGPEIIEGIEGRIAELLVERGGKSGVVPASTMREVISIIGRPEEIFDDADSKGSTDSGRGKTAKKLFRNPDGKVLCGVLGGWASYLNIDPIWLRLGYSALFIVACFIDNSQLMKGCLPGILLLLYLAMCICMPLAQTTAQKCSMRGEPISYNGIEQEVKNKKNSGTLLSSAGSLLKAVLKILAVFIGVILLFVGACGVIALVAGIVAAVFSVSVIGFSVPTFLLSLLSDAAGLPGWTMTLLWVLTALAVLLPFVGLLYAGVSLIFGFKSPKWRPGLVMLLLWLLSVAGIAGIGISATSMFWGVEMEKATEVFDNLGDTLHIEFEGVDQWKDAELFASGDKDSFNLLYVDVNDKKISQVAMYPEIRIHHQSSESPQVRASAYMVGQTPDFFRISNDTLFVSPSLYGNGRPFDQLDMSLNVQLPDNVSVQISDPVDHKFDCDLEIGDWKHLLLTRRAARKAQVRIP